MTDAPGGAAPLLVLEDVAHSFGGVQAVDGVSFGIPQGAFFGLIGPNGAGKTTLLDLISGVLTPQRGIVRFEGRDVTKMPLHQVARQGLVRTFQTSRVFRRMSVMSNLVAGCREPEGERLIPAVLGSWRAQEARAIEVAYERIDLFSLQDVVDNYGSDISGGQQRLVDISRALMTEPRLLLLDEPFAGVSPTNRRKLANQLLGLNRAGLTILMVEHALDLVEEICDSVVMMANGKVLIQGPMSVLRTQQSVVDAYMGTV